MGPPVSNSAQKLSPLETLKHTHPLQFVCSWRGRVSGYFPMHSHRVIELVYHPRGSGITTLGDGRKIEFEPHGTVIYPAFTRHDQEMRVPGDDICLHIAETIPMEETTERLFSEALYIPPSSLDQRRADRFVRTEFLHLAQVRGDSTRRLELNFRVTALVARLLQLKRSVAEEIPQSSPDTYLHRARQFISENYARITSVKEIAGHVGISEDYLRHLFAAHSATTAIRLLNQTKIERVKELLIHSRLPIKEIASLAGFETERYLSTLFKTRVGVSPGAFRRQSTNRTL